MLKFVCLVILFGAIAAHPRPHHKEHGYRSKNATIPLSGTTGIDISSLVLEDTFKCLKSNGYDFVIVRAYTSECEPDYNAIHTIFNARAVGIKYVDVYMFPSPRCSRSASDQVNDMVAALKNADYGQIWLDIEGPSYWHSSESENQDFFNELLSACERHKLSFHIGVYTSASQWDPIMGSGFRGGGSHQLWYAHYDDNPSFSDFSPFGGWSKPSIKQYRGDASVCGEFN
jgi:hypothetical protein